MKTLSVQLTLPTLENFESPLLALTIAIASKLDPLNNEAPIIRSNSDQDSDLVHRELKRNRKFCLYGEDTWAIFFLCLGDGGEWPGLPTTWWERFWDGFPRTCCGGVEDMLFFVEESGSGATASEILDLSLQTLSSGTFLLPVWDQGSLERWRRMEVEIWYCVGFLVLVRRRSGAAPKQGEDLAPLVRVWIQLFRLYTGIHAKPKAKLKQGAISESTTALNVDQTNTSCENVDPVNPLPPPSPHASSGAAGKGASGTDQPAVLGPSNENTIGGPTTAPPASAPQKKEGGAVKAQADKKKIDARKKSLKRL